MNSLEALRNLYQIAESSALEDAEVIECNKLYQQIAPALTLLNILMQEFFVSVEKDQYNTYWLNIDSRYTDHAISVLISEEEAKEIEKVIQGYK